MAATICPHCRLPQSPERWRILGSALKWLGGMTAVLSLLLGIVQLNSLLRTTQERAEAAAQLIRAADLQVAVGDFEGAIELINQALELEPGSQLAHARRVSLAMERLRDFEFNDFRGKLDGEVLESLLPVIYRGAGNKNPEAAADAISHLGWANHLKTSFGAKGLKIDDYFKRALQLDPDNVFAHVFWGNRCLTNSYRPEYENNLAKAKYHYAEAMKSGQYKDYKEYVDKIRWLTLSSTSVDGADIEFLITVNNKRKQNQSIERWMQFRALAKFRDLPLVMEEEKTDRLINAVPAHELLKTYEWLSKSVDFTDRNARPFGMYDWVQRTVHARLFALAGDKEAAVSTLEAVRLQIQKAEITGSAGSYDNELWSVNRVVSHILEIKRGWLGVIVRKVTGDLADKLGLKGTQGVFVQTVVSGSPAEQAGITAGDVILELEGKPVQVDRFNWLVQTALAGTTVSLRIWRRLQCLSDQIN